MKNRTFNNNRKYKSYNNPTRSHKKRSSLDPSLLVKISDDKPVVQFKSNRLISDLPLHSGLKQCLLNKGYKMPTEIQDKSLEALIEGRDLLGIAQTGTGKTGAFLVPLIEQLLKKKMNHYALVVVPTRELARQVEEEFRSITKGLGLYSACFIGGTPLHKDIQQLRRQSHIVIGTPGRLLDLYNRNALLLGKFRALVLDEFDRMLDMGFIHDVTSIVDSMHQRSQSMLFSATLDKSQQGLIGSILNDPVTVKVSSGDRPGDNIDQDIIRVHAGEDKFKLLLDLLVQDEYRKVLLFEETKRKVNKLYQQLNKSGITVEQIHGDKSQGARQSALKAFKDGRVRVLVATDVASRGIHVSDISHVINYQVPMTHDSYIHRIGRTGRVGKTGKALTFVA